MISNQARETIEKYRYVHDLWVSDKNLNISAHGKQEILDAIRTFNPGYTVQLYCGYCIASMIDYAFRELDKT